MSIGFIIVPSWIVDCPSTINLLSSPDFISFWVIDTLAFLLFLLLEKLSGFTGFAWKPIVSENKYFWGIWSKFIFTWRGEFPSIAPHLGSIAEILIVLG